MTKKNLDLSSLEKAIDALTKAIATQELHKQILQGNPDLEATVRSGVIQNFEVAFELSWKFMQRWLKENVGPGVADLPRTRKELFRQAAHAGLIADASAWFEYAEGRNATSHTYHPDVALRVCSVAVRFVKDAGAFLQVMKEND